VPRTLGMAPPSRNTALDWPLSRNEKKSHVLELYDKEVHAANSMLRSGETALQALQQELQTIKTAQGALANAGCIDDEAHSCDAEDVAVRLMPRQRQQESRISSADGRSSQQQPVGDDPAPPAVSPRRRAAQSGAVDTREAAERLQQAIADATDALSALLGAAALQQAEEEDIHSSDDNGSKPHIRSRSEGAERISSEASSALRRGRKKRLSRGGEPLRVSFSECSDKVATEKCDVEICSKEPESPRSLSPHEPNNEPEPSPEDPLTPERQPLEKPLPGKRKLEASPRERLEKSPSQQAWQRTLARAPPAHHRHAAGPLDVTSVPCDDAGSGRSRRREKDRRSSRNTGGVAALRPQPHGGRHSPSEERAIVLAGKRDSGQLALPPPAPATAMDFL